MAEAGANPAILWALDGIPAKRHGFLCPPYARIHAQQQFLREMAMRAIEVSALLLLAMTVAACTSPGTSRPVSTEHFVNTAVASDAFEINSSKLIAGKTHDKQVKQLASQLADDHMKSSQQLKTVLADNVMRRPSSLMTTDQKQTFDRLKKESHFNGDYLDVQMQVHKDAIALFECYASSGDNEALRHFAAKTLPTLKKHLDMIEQVKADHAKNNASYRG
jgi:putative membrane protein